MVIKSGVIEDHCYLSPPVYSERKEVTKHVNETKSVKVLVKKLGKVLYDWIISMKNESLL